MLFTEDPPFTPLTIIRFRHRSFTHLRIGFPLCGNLGALCFKNIIKVRMAFHFFWNYCKL